MKDQVLMLLNMYLPCLKLVCRCKPMSNYFQLFAKGKKKIDKELNVVRLIKNVNAIQTFTKNCIMNDNMKWMISHYHNNIIHLTDSSDSSANEESSDGDDE